MRLIVFFDLPVGNSRQKRNYDRFRKKLLAKGLTAMQFSVYQRYCRSRAFAESLAAQLQEHLPQEGKVRFLLLPEQTFSQMKVFEDQEPVSPEEPPETFILF